MSKTKWYAKPIRRCERSVAIFLALALMLSFSVMTAVPAGAQGGAVLTAITNAADRLVALQSTETLGTLDPPDFGWDWVVTGLTEHSGVASGYNLYGVTALGLIDAYQVTGTTAYFTAAEKTADHLKTLSRATDSTVRIQSFDYRFLVEFSALSGDESYAAHAVSEWDWVKANVAYFYADTNQENIYNFWYTWSGSHGFAAWQAADTGLATLAMGDTSWASNMAAVLAGHLGEITNTDIYRFIGWGHALKFLNAVDSVVYSTQITSLISNLTVSQNADGSWPGTAAQGTVQNTAYAVMGLAAVGEGDAAREGANWLVTNQISSGASIGGWIETDSQEYSENDSEALQALVAPPVIEVDIDHAKIDFGNPGDDEVRVKGKLALDLVNGDGVDISEDVIVTVGTFSATIDGGSMVEKGKEGEKWEYKRPEAGAGSIEKMTIKWKTGNDGSEWKIGKFDISMDKADLSELTNPVTISIQIGDDLGDETILMRVRWDYKAK